ncbi:hypothetical protein [Flexithrix dorotheae]|uniref:hypothetical protein n=1 Tax=Flexithrix dorotheae TaxID=70993 RepID=UPI0003613EB4|nr:hypothetical protein [Flexithrix dorotheae]
MKDSRILHLNKILEIKSPLSLLPRAVLDEAIRKRSNTHDPILDFKTIADYLYKTNIHHAKTRAEFILRHCEGEDCEGFFEQHRESWGLPKFREDLVTINEFKNGFLWRMKDYTTAFAEDGYTRNWFTKSHESLFLRKYEAWDSGQTGDELIHEEYGSCRDIFTKFLKEYGMYDFVRSPIFTTKDLQNFAAEYKEDTALLQSIKEKLKGL